MIKRTVYHFQKEVDGPKYTTAHHMLDFLFDCLPEESEILSALRKMGGNSGITHSQIVLISHTVEKAVASWRSIKKEDCPFPELPHRDVPVAEDWYNAIQAQVRDLEEWGKGLLFALAQATTPREQFPFEEIKLIDVRSAKITEKSTT